jgi:hypothetical protein
MKATDIAWLAGLLEGEGTFFTIKKQFAPRLALSMTDEDVVRRAAALVGSPSVHARLKREKEHHKTQFVMTLTGHRAVGVMMTVFGFMGARRQKKIKEVLARWRQSPYRQKPRGTGVVTNCAHADRRHYAHGLCRPCYASRQVAGEYHA